MGCDIHLYVEIRDGDGWRTALDEIPSPHFDPKDYEGEGLSPEEMDLRSTDLPSAFSARNYGLFAILAGVRNGSGGLSDSGDATEPISEPRGIPEDASRNYRREAERWGADGHSHSWLTLDELFRHDWDRKVVNRSQVRRARKFDYASRTRTVDFSDISPHHRVTDDDSFARKMQEIAAYFGNEVYSLGQSGWGAEFCGWSSEGYAGGWRGIEWTTTHLDQVGGAFTQFLVRQTGEALRADRALTDVRIVFFFDN